MVSAFPKITDTFKVMAEAGALDNTFVQQLRNMAKFRNRLVHLYWEVDDVQVYEFLKTRLDDFKAFLYSLSAFLGWGSSITNTETNNATNSTNPISPRNPSSSKNPLTR